MRILIDINHPAHVHYFKNFIRIMEKRGNHIVVTNRNDQIINKLLDHYKIEHIIRNKRPTKYSSFGSLYYLLKMIWYVYKVAKKEKPDFYLGFASFPCALMSYLFNKPGVIIDDTEHNSTNHFLYSKFCSDILTPHFFEKNMGIKHIRFQAYVEQLYLHSDFFKPYSYFEDQYILLRFISFDAKHDSSVKEAARLDQKIELVHELSKKMKVYISQENSSDIQPYFDQYLLNINPEQMHSVIAGASLFISEGATMASEAGILGVKYYYINPLKVGYISYQEKKLKHAHQNNITELLNELDNITFQKSRAEVVSNIEKETINPTKLLIWFIDNYPNSRQMCNCNTVIDKTFEKEKFYDISY